MQVLPPCDPISLAPLIHTFLLIGHKFGSLYFGDPLIGNPIPFGSCIRPPVGQQVLGSRFWMDPLGIGSGLRCRGPTNNHTTTGAIGPTIPPPTHHIPPIPPTHNPHRCPGPSTIHHPQPHPYSKTHTGAKCPYHIHKTHTYPHPTPNPTPLGAIGPTNTHNPTPIHQGLPQDTTHPNTGSRYPIGSPTHTTQPNPPIHSSAAYKIPYPSITHPHPPVPKAKPDFPYLLPHKAHTYQTIHAQHIPTTQIPQPPIQPIPQALAPTQPTTHKKPLCCPPAPSRLATNPTQPHPNHPYNTAQPPMPKYPTPTHRLPTQYQNAYHTNAHRPPPTTNQIPQALPTKAPLPQYPISPKPTTTNPTPSRIDTHTTHTNP
ncbi:hypothetical protein G9A89_000297 [Geosiphon pyriformis]|nr:hypothetical protein G9A89_000297 [Geosiphon pyriformis]